MPTTVIEGFRDRHGDVWTLGCDGLMYTPETAPFSREHVERKWGPLVPLMLELCACGHPRDAHWKPGTTHEGPDCTRGSAGGALNEPCRCPAYEQFDVDACQHITRCADGACKYRMAAAERQLRLNF